MATILEALKGINAYPIPLRTIVETSDRRGLDLAADAEQDTLLGKQYRLAKADILLWLSIAPNISQGGQSYSFSEEQRKDMRKEARAIYDELEPGANAGCVKYGYKGSRL